MLNLSAQCSIYNPFVQELVMRHFVPPPSLPQIQLAPFHLNVPLPSDPTLPILSQRFVLFERGGIIDDDVIMVFQYIIVLISLVIIVFLKIAHC